jgi:uncharacterized protein (DUF427 family)
MAFLNRLRQSGPSGRRAVAGSTVVAESQETVGLEGNHYFPPDAVEWSRLVRSSQTSVCPWKGVATYYDVVDGDRRFPAAAWVYENPSEAAAHINGHVAFWRGVEVTASSD